MSSLNDYDDLLNKYIEVIHGLGFTAAKPSNTILLAHADVVAWAKEYTRSARLMGGYRQICRRHGIEPREAELEDAIKRCKLGNFRPITEPVGRLEIRPSPPPSKASNTPLRRTISRSCAPRSPGLYAHSASSPCKLMACIHIRLRNAATAAGLEVALARKIGITKQALNDVMLSKREPGPAVLAFLGLRKISPGRTMYTPDDEAPMPRRPRSERRQRAWDGPSVTAAGGMPAP